MRNSSALLSSALIAVVFVCTPLRGELIETSYAEGSVVLSDFTPIPEAQVWVLLGIGLGWVVLLRRRKTFGLLRFLFLLAMVPTGLLDASPQVAFGIDAISVSQRSGAILIPVNLSGTRTSSYDSTVNYSTQSGTAFAETHYGRVSGKLDFDAATSTINISIPIYYTGATSDRFFTVNLSRPYRADLGSPSSIVVTILAEDPVEPVTFRLGATAITTRQGVGAVQIPVYFTGTPRGSEVWVRYRTQAGTANGFDDYDGTSGSKLDFAAGSNQALITIPIYETGSATTKFFNVILDSSSEGGLGTPAAATITILGKGQSPSRPDSNGLRIRTRSARRGIVSIKGTMPASLASQVRRVVVKVGGTTLRARGKQNFVATARMSFAGRYRVTAIVYLQGGGKVTTSSKLKVRR